MDHGVKILKKVLSSFKKMTIKDYKKLFNSAQGMEQVNIILPEDFFIKKAAEFAMKAHGEQLYGDKPYRVHLEHTVEVLYRFDYRDYILICSAWLHDTVEDTNTSIEAIKFHFGEEIADIVYRVTNEPSINRKERAIKTYPKIRSNQKAIVLKLADRIANVETCISQANKDLLDMYKKEYSYFRDSLKIENNKLWSYLDSILGEAL